MGEVYRARDPRLSRDVAIKVLPAAGASDAEGLRRLEQEARAVASLSHPNILAIHDFGLQDDIQYVVSELLVGRTLREVLASGALPVRKTVEYAAQIATGLAAAHDHGVIHRDLKPENLFVTRDGRVKILDFGLAKLLDPARRSDHIPAPQLVETMPGVVLGTAAYMAPEQVRGQRTDQRTDIFTLGVVVYEMLSGRRPFSEASAIETMSAIATKDPPDLTTLATTAPPALTRIVKRCLEKQPEHRFQSARDLAFALESLLEEPPTANASHQVVSSRRTLSRALLGAGAVAIVASVGAVAVLKTGRQVEPVFRLLTFQRGTVRSARFATDGRTIVYSAQWNGKPSQVFVTRAETRESSALNVPAGDLVATTSTGEIVLLAGKGAKPSTATVENGTLARASLMGGGARELIEQVSEADASADGSTFAVVRTVGDRQRLEFPVGKVLYETAGYISRPRLSPRGDRIAFLDHPVSNDDRGVVATVDLAGRHQVLTREWIGEQGLAWSPDGREVWFDAGPGEEPRAIYAVTLDGTIRPVYKAPKHLKLEDVGRDGSVLLSAEDFRTDVIAMSAGDAHQRDLSWFYLQLARALSLDGATLVFSSLSGFDYASYVRKTDGSAAVRLGDGYAQDLSPDGKWVLVSTFSAPNRLTLLPTGPGESKAIELGSVRFDGAMNAKWTPDGHQIIFGGTEAGGRVRSYMVPFGGGRPTAVTPEGMVGTSLSPAGGLLIVRTADGQQALFDLHTNQRRDIGGLLAGERIVRWDASGRAVYAYQPDQVPLRVVRLDVATGAREPSIEFTPSDPSGIVSGLLLTPDARVAVFNVRRKTSDLYLVTGLR
jgi:Tol biopolymer transport system component